ncbi:MAG: BsuBI/PstI family type II restriction endonuclease [Edaphobacter sp.]
MTKTKLIKSALSVLKELGFPKRQQNERSALCLLALLDLKPTSEWADAKRPMLGITPIMDWMAGAYKKKYKPNTRESIRRQTMHQFRDAGLAVCNPDFPSRPTNSGDTVYQIDERAFRLLRKYGSIAWSQELAAYLSSTETLIDKYAKARKAVLVPVKTPQGTKITLTPGAHNDLIKKIIESFAPTFLKRPILMSAGDTAAKLAFFDEEGLAKLGVVLNVHGKMPDVILHDAARNWLFLVESVTSHGPVDGKRHEELRRLFAKSNAGLVFVTAFPSRSLMVKYLPLIAWETEVWVAESPTHLIHFNGDRFLGPYD